MAVVFHRVPLDRHPVTRICVVEPPHRQPWNLVLIDRLAAAARLRQQQPSATLEFRGVQAHPQSRHELPHPLGSRLSAPSHGSQHLFEFGLRNTTCIDQAVRHSGESPISVGSREIEDGPGRCRHAQAPMVDPVFVSQVVTSFHDDALERVCRPRMHGHRRRCVLQPSEAMKLTGGLMGDNGRRQQRDCCKQLIEVVVGRHQSISKVGYALPPAGLQPVFELMSCESEFECLSPGQYAALGVGEIDGGAIDVSHAGQFVDPRSILEGPRRTLRRDPE